MATRREKVNAGLFLLTGVLLSTISIGLVAGWQLRGAGKRYFVRFSTSVGGLSIGSEVTYLGVPVGDVSDIRFDVDDVESVLVVLTVKKQTPIKKGTVASLRSNLLTGKASIELSGGTNQQEDLEEMQPIPWEPTTLKRFEEKIPGAFESLEGAIGDLRDLLSDDNRESVARFLRELGALLADARAAVARLELRVGASLDVLDQTARQLGTDLSQMREDVTAKIGVAADAVVAAGGQVRAAGTGVEKLAEDLQSATPKVRETVEQLSAASAAAARLAAMVEELVDANGEEVASTLQRLHGAARTLQVLLRDVEHDPSILLFGARGSRGGDAR